MIGRRTSFFVPALLLSMLTPLSLPSSSVSLYCFVLGVPMRECLGKHSCVSSPCPIAILNVTFLFSRGEIVCNLGRSFVYQNQTKLNYCLALGLLSTFRTHFTSFHIHYSLFVFFLSLSYFILAVPLRKYWGQHLCMSFTFYVAILHGTSSPWINFVLVGECY